MADRATASTWSVCLTTSYAKAAGLAKTPLSPDVRDPATGLVLPRTKQFASSKTGLVCLGVGVRVKSVAFVNVNVYTVGLYVEPKGARKALKSYAGRDPEELSKDKSVYRVLGGAGDFSKYLHLVFARSVGAQKVVDAFTAVKGVNQDVLDKFSSLTMEGVGKSINREESVTLGWEGKDRLVVLVRDKEIGSVIDESLPASVFNLFLGSDPVSPVAKTAFAEGVPAFLAS
ncbi:Similar to Chalcone Isomerase [Ectocarpus siliculosus]|uniref:Similar to Chalcone Isomerase n=1 Tax=Ectocarpus siliculosus TaxID=2880 RepID=D7G2G9_ECTSI|nr:Similar to Chalcone Isomerase [Ectocarpus siliculosus]|eukprot:CBJ33403.1 Similar to Chalcone Isomerase [Ectocarpus siliculosus]